MAVSNGSSNGIPEPSGQPGIWIAGLGHQYPAYLFRPEQLEELATRFHDVEKPGLKRLLKVNRASGIDQRPSIQDLNSTSALLQRPEMPSITDLNAVWHKAGVELAAQACRKALEEWGGALSDITHMVACTTTCYGNPGVDLLVAERLGLGSEVERILLAGVGCEGGVAIMRVAAQLACGATALQKPARILAFACELCTINARQELADAEATTSPDDISIAAALFSDGAAALVLTNDAGLLLQDGTRSRSGPLFQLVDWGKATIPNTMKLMAWNPCPTGYKMTLTRAVATYSAEAVEPMFSKLLPSFCDKAGLTNGVKAAELDWALHPGGRTIIDGVQKSMGLDESQLSATRHIYRTRGNSSSPTVLTVLDTLRKTKGVRDNVVAVAFGPGMVMEMAFLRRCQSVGGESA